MKVEKHNKTQEIEFVQKWKGTILALLDFIINISTYIKLVMVNKILEK